MIVQTYIREIRSHRATAGAATKRAKAYAQTAETEYARAANYRRYAVQCMTFGRREDFLTQAAEYERMARESERRADRYIELSFSQDQHVAFYRELAARYVEMSRKIEIDV